MLARPADSIAFFCHSIPKTFYNFSKISFCLPHKFNSESKEKAINKVVIPIILVNELALYSERAIEHEVCSRNVVTRMVALVEYLSKDIASSKPKY